MGYTVRPHSSHIRPTFLIDIVVRCYFCVVRQRSLNFVLIVLFTRGVVLQLYFFLIIVAPRTGRYTFMFRIRYELCVDEIWMKKYRECQKCRSTVKRFFFTRNIILKHDLMLNLSGNSKAMNSLVLLKGFAENANKPSCVKYRLQARSIAVSCDRSKKCRTLTIKMFYCKRCYSICPL